VEQDARARDVRLQRALEEVDKYRALLQDIKARVRPQWLTAMPCSRHDAACLLCACLGVGNRGPQRGCPSA
jgi:hypothetical protein